MPRPTRPVTPEEVVERWGYKLFPAFEDEASEFVRRLYSQEDTSLMLGELIPEKEWNEMAKSIGIIRSRIKALSGLLHEVYLKGKEGKKI